MTANGQTPPYNDEAERSLLGAALLSSTAVPHLVAIKPADFHSAKHQHIAESIRRLATRQEPVDQVSATSELRHLGLLEEIGGPEYLAELWRVTPAVSAASYYAGQIRDAAVLRRLLHVSTEIAELSFNALNDPAAAVARARALVDACASESGPSLRSRLLSIDDLAAMPPLEPLVGQLMDLDSIVLAYGKRGGSKSFTAVDLLASVATGTRWHGRPVTQVPTIYVVAEGVAGISARFEAWQQLDRNVGRPLPGDALMVLPEPVNLLNSDNVAVFAETATSVGARLIVLDTLARCMVGGDENSARDAGMAIEQLDLIRRRTGACVVAVHHSGKNLDAGARGSSAFEAAADTVIEIGMTDNITVITCMKQKNHPTPNPIRLRLRSMGSSAVLDDYETDDEEIPNGALETLIALSEIELDGGVPAGAWEVSSGKTRATFFRYRKQLLGLGLVSNIGTDKQPRYQVTDTGGITVSEQSQRSQ